MLTPGLSYGYFTPSLHYVGARTMKRNTPPKRLQLTKCYFRPQIEDFLAKEAEARLLGPAVVSEWHKGIDSYGKERMDDAARFEDWEGLPKSSRLHTKPMNLP